MCIDDGEYTAEQMDELEHALKSNILTSEGEAKVRQLLKRYMKMWTEGGVGKAKHAVHEVKLTDYRPIMMPPRMIPQKFQQALDGEAEKMLRDGVISLSTSPYCTYPVLAAKKDGGIRFAVDYRRLNSITVPDKTPLPRIEDLIAAVEGSKYFAPLDLRSGFWHIPMHEHQKHMTVFRTHRALYHFNVMPFGLINAPATFQRWVNDILGDKRYEGVLLYLDDFLIHAKTEVEFLELFELALMRLERAGAHLKLSKCEIVPKSFDYLGHNIEEGVRRPLAKKIDALNRIKAPKDISGVRSILRMFGFYRLYIPNYSEITLP